MRALRRFLLSGWSLGAVVALVSCASLDPLPSGTCGNGVVDSNEDCDSHDLGSFKCGAPGSDRACKLTCATATECPDGWGCAVDGVCRQPAGVFPTALDPVSSGVTGIHPGDFDGDGRKDILGTGPRSADNTSRARVLYFGAGGVLQQTTIFSAPIASPAIKNLDQDADNTDDFAFGALGSGFGVMTGRKDRTLVPILFPSFQIPNAEVKPVVLRGTRRQVPDSQLDASVDPTTTSTILYAGQVVAPGEWVLSSLGGDARSYNRALTGEVGPLAGGPIWANVFAKDPTSACGEIVLAYQTAGGSEIAVLSPCKPNVTGARAVWASERDPVSITLAKPLLGGVHVADVDGDGNLDVLFSADVGIVQVATGTGTKLNTPVPYPTLTEVPLASGDINADGAIDFVTPSSLVLSAPLGMGVVSRSYSHLTSSRRTRWAYARFGNVATSAAATPPPLGDAGPPPPTTETSKSPFIVAASADQPDIDYFQGTGATFPTSSTIQTSGAVAFLDVGDFDGDTLDDVALVSSNAATGTEQLAYAYGNLVGPPSAPATVGAVSNASALLPIPSATSVVPLLVFTAQPTAGDPLKTLGAAVVLGSGDRQPLAPLILPDSSAISPLPPNGPTSRRWAPVSVMAGPISDPSRVDLTAIAIGYTYDAAGQLLKPPYPVGPWLAPGIGPAAFSPAQQVGDLLQGPTAGLEIIDSKTLSYSAQVIAADIDSPPNGVLEILTLARTKMGEPQLIVVRAPKMAGQPTDVKLTSLAADGVGLASPGLRTTDVDGDGDLDLIAILGAPGPATTPATTKIVVYFNDGGTFRAPPGITIPIPAGADNGPTAITPVVIGGASATAGGTRARALAIVTLKRIFLATLNDSKTAFDVKELTSSIFGATGLRAATSVAAGDYDGDGVEDLAVADDGAVRLVLQQSTQAIRGVK